MVFRKAMALVLVATGPLLNLGCNSNPYGANEKAALSQNKPAPLPPIAGKPIPPLTYDLQVPATVQCTELALCTFTAQAQITGLTPVLSVENLPTGATFDPNSGIMSWTPPTGAGRDPSNPQASLRAYTLNVDLRSTEDMVTVRQKTVTLLVSTKLGNFVVGSFPGNQTAIEGTPASFTFTVSDDDYPNGPFVISSTGAPANMTVSQGTPANSFTVNYSPDYRAAASTDASCGNGALGCKAYNYNLVIVDPLGRQVNLSGEWMVTDVALPPLVYLPSTVTGSNNTATFYVTAEDPNGEGFPEVTVQSGVGSVNATQMNQQLGTDASDPSVYYQVTYSQPPPPPKSHPSGAVVQVTVILTNGQSTTSNVSVGF